MSVLAGSRSMDTYSVFVGHIHSNVTRRELGDLFKACGEIKDVVILESEGQRHNYGFVRYIEKGPALRAVREINNWVLNGVNIVVDISKDTAAKIKRENNEPSSKSKVHDCNAGQGRSNNRPSNAKLFLQDTMYLNRLKETCSNLHLNGTGTIKSKFFLEDVGCVTPSRFPTVWGCQQDPSVNFHHISEKIMKRCQMSAEVDPSFGMAKKEEFLSSLETIVREINGVLCSRYEQTEEANNGESSLESVSKDCSDDLLVKHCLDGIDVHCEENQPNFNETDKDHRDNLKADPSNTEQVSGKLLEQMNKSDCGSLRCEETNEREKSQSLRQLVSGISYRERVCIGAGRGAASFRENTQKCNDLTKFEDSEQEVSEGEYTVKSNGSSRNIDTDEFLDNTSDRKRHEDAEVLEDIHNTDEYFGAETGEISINSDEGSERETESENEIEDPAILDFHLSSFHEQGNNQCSEPEPGDVLNKLFDNISLRRGPRDMVRSVSRDSNMSSESNEGNVDDSGVESDFFSAHGMKNKNNVFQNKVEFGFGDGRFRGSHHRRPGRRSCPETSTEQSLNAAVIPQKAFDLEEYILKSFGRGRGASKQTKVVSRGAFSLK